LPDRTNRVDDVRGRQTITRGEQRLAGRTSSQFSAFGEKLGPCRTMYSPVNPSPPSSEAFAALIIASTFRQLISPIVK